MDNEAGESLMDFFPENLERRRAVASGEYALMAAFNGTARWIIGNLPRCPERTAALRKLLEARDAALRALP